MKSIYLSLAALSFAALVSSCAREELKSVPSGEENLVNITVIASEKPETAPALETTRTYLSGGLVKWADSGEYLRIYQVATPSGGEPVDHSNKKSNAGTTDDGGSTMAFTASLKTVAGASYSYYAFYPNSAQYNSSDVETNVRINTPATQTPSSTSFDPAADLLIAKGVDAGTSQPASFDMQFARLVAIGKMTVKNLESSDDIEKITFSAKNGDTPIKLAGRTPFNLTTGLPVSDYGSGAAEYSIALDYSGQGITADDGTGMVAYFTCYPFSLAAGDSFTVVVETESQTFTKKVDLAGVQTLVLKEGKSSVFSVDMDDIDGVDKAVDLPYAYLDFAEYHALALGDSYVNNTLVKPHQDKWQTFCLDNGSSIRIRRNDGSSSNDSYIKLPDFKENIRRVVVTLKEAATAYTLTLENTPTASSGTIASKEVSVDELTHEFDLTSANVKTAYLRAKGTAASVAKVEVYAGTDTRPTLSAPASVTAVLNGSIINAIDVSGYAVANATGYTIVLTPSVGDAIEAHADSDPKTVTGLGFATSYTVGVKALGDVYVVSNGESAVTNAASPVVTGTPTTATYTIASKTTASLTSGTAPGGSAVSYEQAHSELGKLTTSYNYIQMTISGYDGKTIVGASVSVRSAKQSGQGSLSLSTNGNSIASIATSAFNTSSWNGAWSESFVDKVLTVTPTVIESGKTIVLRIEAASNTLYFESLTLQYI